MSILWSDLRVLGNSKLITSNYFWIFLIPFLTINFERFSTFSGVDLFIPFSVSKFFYASLCFAIGTLIYQVRCPLMIKQNSSLSDFESEGKTMQHIIDYLQLSSSKIGSKVSCDDIFNFVKDFDKTKDVDCKAVVGILNRKREVESVFIDSELRADFFWKTYNKLNCQFRISAVFCFIFYFLGLSFLFVSAIVNVFYALKLFICEV
ncbi:hypothetical protein [Shewanella pealeana]|uniref:hypothetical protein n=1 Tax=Shewanella pealeana TaxID=70864 RepID=UPI00059CB37C|nr:hypothetical protein [Shewanella pealeana]